MLVEEVDRLHIELWHARLQATAETSVETNGPTEDVQEPVELTLHARLQRVLRRETAAPAEQPLFTADEDRTSSARAWIAALRREE
jgi:hypothetical protein